MFYAELEMSQFAITSGANAIASLARMALHKNQLHPEPHIDAATRHHFISKSSERLRGRRDIKTRSKNRQPPRALTVIITSGGDVNDTQLTIILK